MTTDIVYLKMPFKVAGILFREKEVPFMFKIMTLEMVCEHLEISLQELFSKKDINNYDLSLSIVWNGYLAACMELYKETKHKYYRTPKYSFTNAVIWHEHMSQDARDKYVKELQEMLGKFKGNSETETDEKKK
jgi:tRNA G10  N-methylase Trm11